MREPLLLRHPLTDIQVETESAVVEAQLRERLAPYVDVRRGAPQPSPDLTITTQAVRAPLPTGPGQEVMIRDHRHVERFRRPGQLWKLATEYVLLERKNSSVFRWDVASPASVSATNLDELALAKSVRRLIQDFLRLWVAHRGGIIVEASTIATDEVDLLAVGGSGTGKTTLLARFLSGGSAMVSNDEVALCPEGDGVVAYGLPMLVNVRPTLVEQFPKLDGLAEFMEGNDPKAAVRYDTFVHTLGGHVRSSARRLVGVLLESESEPTKEVSAPAFASALADNLLSGPGTVGRSWDTPWRLLPPGLVEPPPHEMKRRAMLMAARVPAIAIGRKNHHGDVAAAARGRLREADL